METVGSSFLVFSEKAVFQQYTAIRLLIASNKKFDFSSLEPSKNLPLPNKLTTIYEAGTRSPHNTQYRNSNKIFLD
jgi:hypothetical protein